MTELVCIVCPKGCRLTVDEKNSFKVEGAQCTRGKNYGKKELVNPTRTLTLTVQLKGSQHKRCPLKTDGEIPKNKVRQAAELLRSTSISPPIFVGDIIMKNILGTGVDFVATKSIIN